MVIGRRDLDQQDTSSRRITPTSSRAHPAEIVDLLDETTIRQPSILAVVDAEPTRGGVRGERSHMKAVDRVDEIGRN